jgi:YVTN family beta-propeller protein
MPFLARALGPIYAVLPVAAKTFLAAGSIGRRPSPRSRWLQEPWLFDAGAATGGEMGPRLSRRSGRGSKLLRAQLLGMCAALFLTAGAAPGMAQTTVALLSEGGVSGILVAVNPVTNQVFVGTTTYSMTKNTYSVLVLDGATNQLVTTIPLGGQPDAMAVNPATNTIYVAVPSLQQVSVISGANWSVSNVSFPASSGLYAIAVNPVTNKIYVTEGSSAANSIAVVDGATNTITTTIALPGLAQPDGLGVNSVTNTIYTVNSGTRSVSVINGASNTLTTTITVTSPPMSIAVNEVTNTVYLGCGYAGNQSGVEVIDGATNNTAFLPLTGLLGQIVVNPVTNMVYATESPSLSAGETALAVINGATNAVTLLTKNFESPNVDPNTNEIYGQTGWELNGATNEVGVLSNVADSPMAIAINPVTNKVYIACIGKALTVIDEANNQTATVNAGTGPSAVAVNPATNTAYVVNSGSGNVTAIGGTSNATATIPAGENPAAVAVNAATNTAYVANSGSNTVTAINGANDTTTTLCVGTAPSALAVNPATNTVYVANSGSNNVTVINGTNGATTLVPVGSAPSAIAVNPATNMIYVANSGSSNVTVINGATDATSTVNVGSSPSAIAVNPVTNMIYVANAGSGNVTVIIGATNSTSTVIAGTNPVAIAVNPITNMIYVANAGSDNVTVINGMTNATATVSAGSSPSAVAVDATSNKIYVTNSGATTITIIDGPTNTVIPVTAASGAAAVAVNPVTNVMYIANSGGTVTVLTENPIQAIPLTTAIAPIGGTTTNTTPTFTFTAASTFSPNVPGIENVYYQIDTTQGEWTAATAGSGGNYTATPASALSPGTHIVYAYSADGQDATREFTNLAGVGVVLTGQIAAQVFTIVEPAGTAGPSPSIGNLMPPSATAGSPGFTLTVNGTNFANDSIVSFACIVEPTTQVSANQLTAAIPASAIENAGTAAVTVTNPAVGGGTISSSVNFTIDAAGTNNPVPAITMLNPASVTAGSAGLMLTVTGSNFISSSVVNFNGVVEATSYVSATELMATINASDIATAGMVPVTVTNPTPGGGTSNAVNFTINAAVTNNPVPAITILNPASATAGSAGFTLTVTGSNFISSSVVSFNGAAEATSYVSATEVIASIPASAILNSGTAGVTVTNPTPGGGTSNAVNFTINAPATPEALLSTNTVTFPSTVVNFTAAAISVTLSNPGTATLSSIAVSITGSNISEFSLATGANACGSTLGAGSQCSIYVTFTPAAATSYSATLQVSNSAAGSPQTASLSGTGILAPSFTVSSNTTPQTVQPGGSAEYSISVIAQNGTFAGSVTLRASGLPPGATASFSPASLTPGSSSASSTLTIHVATSAALTNRGSPWPFAAPALAIIGIFFLPGKRRRRWITLTVLAVASLGAFAALTACGGGFGLTGPAQTYTVTVTGTSGAQQQTTTVQLTVE